MIIHSLIINFFRPEGGFIFMIISVIKEIKNNENRVGLTPAGSEALIRAGHTVLVEKICWYWQWFPR